MDFSGIESRLDTNNSGIETINSGIKTANSRLNTLSTMNQSLDNIETRVSSGFNDVSGSLDSITGILNSTEVDQGLLSSAVSSFTSAYTNSDLYRGVSNIGSIVDFSRPSSCPALSFNLPIFGTISANIHCTIWTTVSPILTLVMSVVWTIVGFRIFMD